MNTSHRRKIEETILCIDESFTILHRHQQLQQLRFRQSVFRARNIRGHTTEPFHTEFPFQFVKHSRHVRTKRFVWRGRSHYRRVRLRRQTEHTVRTFKPFLLHRRQFQLFNRHLCRTYQIHIPRQTNRQPRQSRHNITIERIQLVQIVDEQEQHLVLQIFAASQQILKPIVDVQRIERRVFRQIALGNVENYRYLLTDDAQQFQIVGGPRSGRRKSYDPMHFTVFDPFGYVLIEPCDKCRFAGTVFAVYEYWRMASTGPITLQDQR